MDSEAARDVISSTSTGRQRVKPTRDPCPIQFFFFISQISHRGPTTNALQSKCNANENKIGITREVQNRKQKRNTRDLKRTFHNESEKGLTPSTTNSSPHMYWLALLARNTTGPAKSAGSPHLPAGIRSLIWRRRVGSARSFSFLQNAQNKSVSHPNIYF